MCRAAAECSPSGRLVHGVRRPVPGEQFRQPVLRRATGEMAPSMTSLPPKWLRPRQCRSRPSPASGRSAVQVGAAQVGAATVALKPLHYLIADRVMAAERLHADDTTVPILAKGRTTTGRVRTYVRDDRPFGGLAFCADGVAIGTVGLDQHLFLLTEASDAEAGGRVAAPRIRAVVSPAAILIVIVRFFPMHKPASTISRRSPLASRLIGISEGHELRAPRPLVHWAIWRRSAALNGALAAR